MKSYKEFLETKDSYYISVTFVLEEPNSLQNFKLFENTANGKVILEYTTFGNFKSSTNKYRIDKTQIDGTVKRHYTVLRKDGKTELYSINIEDGSPHHRSSKGYVIPKKEVKELKDLGINIDDLKIQDDGKYILEMVNIDSDISKYTSEDIFILISSND